jgi:hypothetical protein
VRAAGIRTEVWVGNDVMRFVRDFIDGVEHRIGDVLVVGEEIAHISDLLGSSARMLGVD